MNSDPSNAEFPVPQRSLDPFRRAVIRGLAILLPPLLTIVIFLWVGNTVANYMLDPMEDLARNLLVRYASDIHDVDEFGKPNAQGLIVVDGKQFRATADGKYIPLGVYDAVRNKLGTDPMPVDAKDIYIRYINQNWLQREFVIPVFLCLLILVLYLLGKFLAAGVGRFFWTQMERVIHRVPLVRNVYSSVKQVTDFMFTDPDVDYTRVVAVEYPRKGIWTVAFVTGESMAEIRDAAHENVISVLIPTSPMPFTGFTVTVKKSETIELDISVDQAFQFVISCGVVVPPQQIADARARQAASRAGKPMALSAPVSDDD
jgi:uncharacterized membrane protein